MAANPLLCFCRSKEEEEESSEMEGGGQKDVTECICIQGESYRTRDESSMETPLSACRLVRQREQKEGK